MVFAAPDQSFDFRLALTERIEILDTLEPGGLSDREDECLVGTREPYFKASIVDLVGDGKQEIVVDSNSVGACSSCLSEVRVYQIEKNSVTKVVDEVYSDIKFGKGQGLWLHSFRIVSDGRTKTFEKTFFGAKNPQSKPK